jgi:hypothetical protein
MMMGESVVIIAYSGLQRLHLAIFDWLHSPE